ncbi:MAG: hypothetical protein K6G12_03155 [Lachnospiraceae bacterium]|nr:hypothetical protein [Lachnospiraceae bacterium]
MSPRTGRPTTDPKTVHVGYRMSPTTVQKLDECCEALNMSKSDIIRLGIEKVHAESFKIERKNK